MKKHFNEPKATMLSRKAFAMVFGTTIALCVVTGISMIDTWSLYSFLSFTFFLCILPSICISYICKYIVKKCTTVSDEEFQLVQSKIDRCKELATIVNTTTNRTNFFESLNEIKELMYQLTEYEGKIPFTVTPSDNLNTIIENEKEFIFSLEKRIKEEEERIKNEEERMKTEKINSKLKRVKILANTINSTTDRSKFYACLTELKQILYELSEYEDNMEFEVLPSDQLQAIIENEKKIIDFLEKRIIRENFHLETFAMACNNYLAKQDEMELCYESTGKTDMLQNNLECPQTINGSKFVDKKGTNTSINYDLMEGYDFESFCADLLKKNGFTDVAVTKNSGDHGIDIIAYNNGIKYGIQCKCYSSNIGNKAVQEAYMGKSFYDCDIAVVLTNSFFTSSAKEEAQKTRVRLWDRNKLEELIKNQV